MRDAAFLSGALIPVVDGTGALGGAVVLTQPPQTMSSSTPPAPSRAAGARSRLIIGPSDNCVVAMLPCLIPPCARASTRHVPRPSCARVARWFDRALAQPADRRPRRCPARAGVEWWQ